MTAVALFLRLVFADPECRAAIGTDACCIHQFSDDTMGQAARDASPSHQALLRTVGK